MTMIARPMAASRLHGVERLGELALEIVIAGAFPEVRTHDAGADVFALQPAGFVFAGDLISEQVLRDDDVAFGADHFGDLGDAARTVAQTFGLQNDVDRS